MTVLSLLVAHRKASNIFGILRGALPLMLAKSFHFLSQSRLEEPAFGLISKLPDRTAPYLVHFPMEVSNAVLLYISQHQANLGTLKRRHYLIVRFASIRRCPKD